MLEDCLIDSRSSARPKKPGTMIVSVLVHGSLLAALVLIPLFQIPLLPQVSSYMPLPPPAGPRSVELVPTGGGAPSAANSAPIPQSAALTAPPAPPTDIVKYVDRPAGGGCVGCLPSSGAGNGAGIPGGGVDFSIEGPRLAPPTPPPAPPAAPPKVPDPVPSAPVRMTSSIMESRLIFTVKPEYPLLAIRTHVQGPVLLEAVVTRNGTIDPKRLRVISGHPMLAPAAVEAVEKWRYQPTILNGQPVEVLATITVNFTLN